MIARNDMRWCLKFFATAFLVVGFCAVLAKFGPPALSTIRINEPYPQFAKYQREDIPEIILVGSSLTYRLYDTYFLPMKMTNIASAGSSPLTGLEIVASYPKLPNVVLVEVNTLIWGKDPEVVERFSSGHVNRLAVIRPVQAAMAYLNRGGPRKPSVSDIDDLLKRKARDYDNAIYVQRALAQSNSDRFDREIEAHVAEFAAVVNRMRSRGARVYLYEMPAVDAIRESHTAVVTRNAVHARFSNSADWLDIKYPAAELRFPDHAHLDDRSALLVARAMRDAISARLR